VFIGFKYFRKVNIQ